ncbi:unnamed protein product, partial [Coregonus sp. 'balchen']
MLDPEPGVQPLLIGKPLYTPDTPAIRNVMERAGGDFLDGQAHCSFLSTPNKPRKEGAPSTWLDVYTDLNNTITTLAQVTQ